MSERIRGITEREGGGEGEREAENSDLGQRGKAVNKRVERGMSRAREAQSFWF